LKIIFYTIYISFFTLLNADIGHFNYIYEGKVFNNPVRIIIKAPGVVPGLADIVVKTFDHSVDEIFVTPIAWKEKNNWDAITSGPQGAPPPDLMAPIRGEKNTYQAELWLMDFGAYNIQINITKNNQSEVLNIPINSIANQITPMTRGVSTILFLLMILLVAGLSNIITVGYRESTLNNLKELTNRRIKKSYLVQLGSLTLISFLLYFGNDWWTYTEQLFMQNLFKPLENQVKIINNESQHILQIFITDEDWNSGRISDFIPDHGKIMHLYLINKNYEQLCHIHPKRNKDRNNLFEVVIPPIEYGEYHVFMDVVLESGATQTLTNTVNYNINNINFKNKQEILSIDDDDSYISPNPNYTFKWANKRNKYLVNNEIELDFYITDNLNQSVALEPYIQMGGHGAILDESANTFIHIHPIGTISMASQELYNQEYNISKSGICYFGTPNDSLINYSNLYNKNSFLSFPPVILSKPGKYFMWIQGKSNNEIVTEKFEFNVIDE
jgi:hypothetical protein